MANSVKVTVEWCAEDRARLDRIIELLSSQSVPKVGTTPDSPAEEPEAETPEPTVTMEDVKALVQKLIAPTTEENKRKAARAFVKSHANKVSEIPADKLAEVYDGLSKIDKGA